MASKRKEKPTKMWRVETYGETWDQFPRKDGKRSSRNRTEQNFGIPARPPEEILKAAQASLRREMASGHCQPGAYAEVWVGEIVWTKVKTDG